MYLGKSASIFENHLIDTIYTIWSSLQLCEFDAYNNY